MTAVQHTTAEKKKAILIYIYTFGKYSIQSDLYHIQCIARIHWRFNLRTGQM